MDLQKQLQTEIATFTALQKDYDKIIQKRTLLESQLQENTLVLKEFQFPHSKIYKQIGPCLVPQELEESIQNVEKRIEFIKGEVKRSEVFIKELQEKQEKKKLEIVKLETALQQQLSPS